MRKLGGHHQADLSKQLLTAKQNAQVTFLRSILQNTGKVLQVCKKRHKGHNIPAFKDFNGRLITGSIEKEGTLNSCCAFV